MAEARTATERRAARKRARRRRLVLAAVAVVIVGGGAGTAWAMTTGGNGGYRLATVQRGTVAQTLTADGTLSATNRATVGFAAAGTVAAVRVGVGDHVTAGQTLATLDTASLDSAVTAAEQTVAQAQERLAADETAQADGTTSTAGTGSAGTGSAGSASHETDSAGSVRLTSVLLATPSGSGSSGLGAAQRAVVVAQHALDQALSAVGTDLHTAGTTCSGSSAPTASAGDQGTVAADGTVSGQVSQASLVILVDATNNSVTSQAPDATGGYRFSGLTAGDDYTVVDVSATDVSDCSSAVAQAAKDQSAAAAASRTLAAAITRLSSSAQPTQGSGGGGAAGRSGSAAQSATGRSSGSAGNGSSSSGSASRGATGQGASTGTVVTAAQIAADEKSVDAADAALAVARQNRGYATLTSPISGTVGAVTLATGNRVSASSASSAVTVVGAGAMSTQVDIDLAHIDLVKVGEHAQVTVDGRSAPLAATVSYVGATNASSSTGSAAAYPVTVTLAAADAKLFDGMGASVAVDVGTAAGVLTVPVSALHTTGRLHTVLVYAGGKTKLTPVTIGVTGSDRAQVSSGLSAGQRVVLAELGTAVPSSSTTGRFGGGGLGGGGLGGGLGGGGRVTRFGGR